MFKKGDKVEIKPGVKNYGITGPGSQGKCTEDTRKDASQIAVKFTKLVDLNGKARSSNLATYFIRLEDLQLIQPYSFYL